MYRPGCEGTDSSGCGLPALAAGSRATVRQRRGAGWLACTLLFCIGSPGALAGTLNDFGMGGILDVPSARMLDDGTLSVTYSRKDIVDLYNISFQATPWLEASFRYAIFNPRGLARSDDDLKDRSFEIKARLIREGRYMPQVAAGIRDLVGTGRLAGEYLVASKAFGPLDVTVGLGWGQLAGRDIGSNPLGRISGSFNRRSSAQGEGGDFRFGDYFSGPDVGLFGGLRYELPRWNLAAVAAYNSDNYERAAVRFGTVSDTDPWSFGLEWEPIQDIVVGASWQQGNQFALRISSSVNTSTPTLRKPPNRYGASGSEPAPSRRPHRRQSWFDRAAVEAHSSGLLLRSATALDEKTLNVVYTNQDYQYEADAIRRLVALVNLYAPRDYRTVVLTGQHTNVDTHSVQYMRPGRSRWAGAADVSQERQEPVVLPPLRVTEPDETHPFRYPNGVWNANLGFRPFLFDPDKPFRYQLYARIGAQVDFGNGWGFSTSWVQNLHNNFSGITRESDSVLPRVRSDVTRYLREGISGLDTMVLTKSGQWTDDVYYLGFAGVLEEMYSGVGGEVLYRPFGSRFAFGANLIGVQQRAFDRSFSLRDYRTAIGHLSVYWASPLYNFDVALHVGRYLARDVGATLEVQKRFANGWSVGAFATQTDVSSADFGEGSFDKGLIFRIPFNAFTGINTRGAYSAVLRPIQRDGGQRLHWGTTLWETHRATHYDHLSENRSRMMPP